MARINILDGSINPFGQIGYGEYQPETYVNESHIFGDEKMAQEETIYQGVVKWFNKDKGFGFIKSSQFNEDIFAHYSEVNKDGFKTLYENQVVSFKVKKTNKGTNAIDIKILSEKE